MTPESKKLLEIVRDCAKLSTEKETTGYCGDRCCSWSIEYIDAKKFIQNLEREIEKL
jgi:hypothetical protein